MKKTKIIACVLLALSLVFSLAVPALADTELGTITVENAIAKQSYYVYRIFDLLSYNKSSGAYSYTVNNAWSAFVNQDNIKDKYVTLETPEDITYVKWVDGADAAEFAQLALAYANANPDTVSIANGITPLTDGTIVFEDLPLGYYLVDSSVGALCILTTNDPDAVVNDKNELTTVRKLVKEDSTGDYGTENSAKLGETVSFKSEITIGKGAHNLVLHDSMNADLVLQPATIKLYIKDAEIDPQNYTLTYAYIDTDNVYHGLADLCTFEISFEDDYVSALPEGTIILVEYNAVVKWDAKEWKSFNNDTWVVFGDDIKSTVSTTTTNTYSFDLVKTDESGKVIQTATFYLYDSASGGNIIPLVALSEDEDTGVYRYRVATENDTVDGNGAVLKAGYAYVYGLDKEFYYLQEIDAPDGYNKLAGRTTVDLSNGDITVDTTGSFYGTKGSVIGSDATDRGGVQIINKTGTLLPSTGGIGTTLFYIIGGCLVAVTGVLFITMGRVSKKKR